MGTNRNKSSTAWQTWQFIASLLLSHSIQQCHEGLRAWVGVSGRRHFVHLSLACVLSLAIFGVLLQSLELCLVLGLASILSLANFLGFATCQYIEASETFKFCNFVGLVFCQSCELCTTLK